MRQHRREFVQLKSFKPGDLVRVICRAEGWLMVRLPNCVPFVVNEREVVPQQEKTDGDHP